MSQRNELIRLQVVTAHDRALDVEYAPRPYEEYCYWKAEFKFLPRIGDAIYRDHLIFEVKRVFLFPWSDGFNEELEPPTLAVKYIGTHVEVSQRLGLRDSEGYWINRKRT